jgi:hypothetical protein
MNDTKKQVRILQGKAPLYQGQMAITNCFRSNIKGRDAEPKRTAFWFGQMAITGRHGCRLQWFHKFLLRKNLQLKNGTEAIFEQRKG